MTSRVVLIAQEGTQFEIPVEAARLSGVVRLILDGKLELGNHFLQPVHRFT